MNTKGAVIGTGYWGKHFIRILSGHPNIDLTMICDADKNALERFSNIPDAKRVTDVSEVAKSPDVDFVVVVIPAELHYVVSKQLIENGKHVLIEKPLTTNVEQAIELAKLAKEKGVHLIVDHTFLFSPRVWKIKELLSQKKIGDNLYYIQSTRTNLGIVRPNISVVDDLAPHELSIFMYLLNEDPKWVSACGTSYLPGSDFSDAAFVTVGFSNITTQFHISWANPSKSRMLMIVGNEGCIEYDDTDQIEPIRIFEKSISAKEDESFGSWLLHTRDGDIISPKINESEPLSNVVNHCLQVIKGETTNTISNADLAISVLKTIDAIHESIKESGKKINVA